MSIGVEEDSHLSCFECLCLGQSGLLCPVCRQTVQTWENWQVCLWQPLSLKLLHISTPLKESRACPWESVGESPGGRGRLDSVVPIAFKFIGLGHETKVGSMS